MNATDFANTVFMNAHNLRQNEQPSDPKPASTDGKTKELGEQFFDALKSEDVPVSPLKRTPTLRVTPKEWSDIMEGNVRFVRREEAFSVSEEDLAEVRSGKKDLAEVTKQA